MTKSQTTRFSAEINSIFVAAEKRMARLADSEHGNMRRLNVGCKRNHPKRHSENKERSFKDRQQSAKSKKQAAEYIASRKKFLSAAQSYWQGKGDHP